MSVALKVYERLTEAGEDRAKAQVIAEAFEQLEERYPQLKEVATQGQVRETELRLQKEIEGVRLEIREAELRQRKEIESVRLEIREIEARLARDIEQSRRESREMEVRLTSAIHRQTLWIIGSVGAVVGAIRLLEWLLARL